MATMKLRKNMDGTLHDQILFMMQQQATKSIPNQLSCDTSTHASSQSSLHNQKRQKTNHADDSCLKGKNGLVNTNNIKDTVPPLSLDYYNQQRQQLVLELQQAEDTNNTPNTQLSFATTFKLKMQHVRSLYLYGLEQISNLQDVRNAPDAIMPGNILPVVVAATPATTATATVGTSVVVAGKNS
jgi:hypothetical protein